MHTHTCTNTQSGFVGDGVLVVKCHESQSDKAFRGSGLNQSLTRAHMLHEGNDMIDAGGGSSAVIKIAD